MTRRFDMIDGHFVERGGIYEPKSIEFRFVNSYEELKKYYGDPKVTLDKLMESYPVPGSVRVREESWHRDWFFIPYFRDKNGSWRGMNQDGAASVMSGMASATTWTKPDPKPVIRTLYQWLIRQNSSALYFQTDEFFATESDVRKVYANVNFARRLDQTKQTVEVDGK